MANKNVNILLKLTDQFTGPLKHSSSELKTMKRQMALAENTARSFATKAAAGFTKMAKAAGVAAAGLGALALKTGFSEALDLEGYRMQLETATKDTKKAADIMEYAINMANRTPFEGGELVEGAAKFEAMGMSAKKWLTYAGDMAAATNKGFDQSVEALIDAQTGELERLKEFGITKAMIQEQAEKMFSDVQVVNNKGQIVNQEKFNEAMLALMEDKYAGGMEKQATTVRGMWSTVTGITKNALANIVGMTNSGEIAEGSLLASLRDQLSKFSDTLQKWQSDGTIQKWAAKANEAFQKLSTAIGWVIDHANTLLPLAGGVMGVFGGATVILSAVEKFQQLKKTFDILVKGFKAFKAMGGLSVIFSNPIILIIAAITAAIILLWKKSETFRNFVKGFGSFLKTLLGGVRDLVVGLKDAWVKAFETIRDKVSSIVQKIKKALQPLIDTINTVKNGLSALGFSSGNGNNGSGHDRYGNNALGTPYWKGGPTAVHERGGEIINLPSGTQIIPHDVSEKAVGGNSVTVNLTIQGNVIGNRAFMEQTGQYIVGRILAAQGVV